MLNGYKFRLYPNPEQQQILPRWIGCQRLIYNAKVQEDRYYRRFQQRMVGTAGEEIPLDQAYSRFITGRTAFLRKVPAESMIYQSLPSIMRPSRAVIGQFCYRWKRSAIIQCCHRTLPPLVGPESSAGT